MLPYNTDMDKLKMPEYGRILQQMVDYCVGLTEREERNVCARSIAATMKNMLLASGAEEVSDKKIWDQLNIIAGFKLDIDFPVDVITQEELNPEPEPIPYSDNNIRLRHYGRTVESMTRVACEMDDGPERDEFIFLLANHMKKLLVMHNREAATDRKVLRDLADFTHGLINLDPETYVLNTYTYTEPESSKKKKKKK